MVTYFSGSERMIVLIEATNFRWPLPYELPRLPLMKPVYLLNFNHNQHIAGTFYNVVRAKLTRCCWFAVRFLDHEASE